MKTTQRIQCKSRQLSSQMNHGQNVINIFLLHFVFFLKFPPADKIGICTSRFDNFHSKISKQIHQTLESAPLTVKAAIQLDGKLFFMVFRLAELTVKPIKKQQQIVLHETFAVLYQVAFVVVIASLALSRNFSYFKD